MKGRRGWRGVILLLALGAGATSAASAQRPHRSGFWFELGAGPATARVGCAGCAEVTTASGSSGYLRLGGTISDGVLLGVENFDFVDERFGFRGDADQSITAETSTLGVVVIWFPWRAGFFLKGGVGIANGTFTVQPAPGTRVKVEGTGVGMTFGVGYEINLSRRFALTTTAAAYVTALGDLQLPATKVDDAIASLYHLTVGLTVR
jgi:hypothetical protein